MAEGDAGEATVADVLMILLHRIDNARLDDDLKPGLQKAFRIRDNPQTLMVPSSGWVEAEANASKLKPAQWAALRYLAKAAPSARTNNAFARYHQTTTGTVTLTLKALFEKGLLQRETDPQDKRLVRFDITPKGEKC